MAKSIHTRDNAKFLAMLREAREESGLTQTDLAKRLRTNQSSVSKCERGERRLDVIELRRWCRAIGISFASFAKDLDKKLG